MTDATPITDADLAALDAAVGKATAAPWEVNTNYPHRDDDLTGCFNTNRYVEGPEKCVCTTSTRTRDVEAIAALRNSYAALRARLDAAEAEVERHRAADATNRLAGLIHESCERLIKFKERITALEAELLRSNVNPECGMGVGDKPVCGACVWCEKEKAESERDAARAERDAVLIGHDELRRALEMANYRLGGHFHTCASYSTSDDDVTEHFDPEQCDCGLNAALIAAAIRSRGTTGGQP